MRLDLLSELNRAHDARRVVALVTELDTGAQRLVHAEAFETDELAAIISERRARRESGLVEWKGRRLFLTICEPPLRLVIVGAGRIAQALVAIARLAGYATTVVDPRAAFATPDRFPDTDLVIDWPDAAFDRLKPDPNTAVACLSHDPKIDDLALDLALRAGCGYVGALGSRKSHASRVKRLQARGLDDATIRRLHAPIGLDIGAVDPAEIAVAVMAEIIASARGKGLRAHDPAPAATEESAGVAP
jgi:xanthine dehydrogenase accessory factor